MADLADEHLSWPVVGTRDLHRDDWVVALREDVVQRPGHPEETFGRLVVEHPGAVVVLALDEEERVCCLRQYRHAAGGVFIELPAGSVRQGRRGPAAHGGARAAGGGRAAAPSTGATW